LTGKHRNGLGQRLGNYHNVDLPKNDSLVIWLHGASVGEVQAARILAAKIKNRYPSATLIMSTTTEQGRNVATRQLAELATCVLAPLDFPSAVSRAVRFLKPDIYICLETELWPNLLARLKDTGCRMFLLNARLSERSCRRYRRLKGFANKVLDYFDGIAAITEDDGRRFVSLGANPKRLLVTGNAKYDLQEVDSVPFTGNEWREILGLSMDAPVLVAGSTHTGEEEMMLDVFQHLQKDLPGLILILAPRHVNRLKAIREKLTATGAAHESLTEIREHGRKTAIVLVDTMGELSSLYAVASYIFCGGSLVPRGGHNIMEAAIWGVPVFYGPSMKDFANAGELLERSGGGFQVSNTASLIAMIRKMNTDSQNYKYAAKAARQTALGQHGSGDLQLEPVFEIIRDIEAHNASQQTSSVT